MDLFYLLPTKTFTNLRKQPSRKIVVNDGGHIELEIIEHPRRELSHLSMKATASRDIANSVLISGFSSYEVAIILGTVVLVCLFSMQDGNKMLREAHKAKANNYDRVFPFQLYQQKTLPFNTH